MEENGYLYAVKLHVIVEITTPPDDPDLKAHLLENVMDYLSVVNGDAPITRYDGHNIIDSYELLEVRDL